jgi:hypothetical protein
VERPDEVIRHVPAYFGGCGGDLAGGESAGKEAGQVFDLPAARLAVVEHRTLALARTVALPIDVTQLAASVENKLVKKYHWALGESLLAADYASSRLDLDGAVAAARGLLGDEVTGPL